MSSADEILRLDANDYTLSLTHEVMHPKMRAGKVSNDQYLEVSDRTALRLRFSADRKTVEILPHAISKDWKMLSRKISGELTSGDAGTRIYEVDEGLRFMGRLEIEASKTGLAATLIKFGSGVPVIMSVRGRVDPTTQKDGQSPEEDFFFEMVESRTVPEAVLKGDVLTTRTKTRVKKVAPPKATRIQASRAVSQELPGHFQIEVFVEKIPHKHWIPSMKLGEDVLLYNVEFHVPEGSASNNSFVIYSDDKKQIQDWVAALAKLLNIDPEGVVQLEKKPNKAQK